MEATWWGLYPTRRWKPHGGGFIPHGKLKAKGEGVYKAKEVPSLVKLEGKETLELPFPMEGGACGLLARGYLALVLGAPPWPIHTLNGAWAPIWSSPLTFRPPLFPKSQSF